ncbi:SulP family sulfate permease [Coleophoma cylindrospora]|uniref:SulP family sulfate permease n=1 Tax=Coleophoma cylindrospora TaxID=1849047 RepID=A0A3D8S8X3_9HELO|nr:SulP family sulfate permease [Coleophoma cylindrospora]
MKLVDQIRRFPDGVRNDYNLNRAKNAFRTGTQSLPSATNRYLLEKVPIVNWISNYSTKWILNDVIAGLTIGVLLVPQALAYAKIATIPLQDGLLASWVPGLLYVIMGTSKDISTGPTSIIGLLTAQIIADVSKEGFTPAAIASAIAFSVGIYALIMGLLRLGFLLDFISLPVLTGFVGAAGLTILIGQVPALFGETGVGSGVANQIHDIITKLPQTKPLTFVIGFSGIFLLQLLQFLGKKYGKQYRVFWILSIGRNAIVLVLFTGISFGINKDLKKPLFDLTSTVPSGLVAPSAPTGTIISKVFSRSIAVFVAAALEHIAIAKSFARRNGYVIDESQELTFIGATNLLNSVFGGMAVGGAFSRTAVNSESGVKSPLSGLFTSATVLASIYFLTGAIFWIPKATLSAVIVAAVWQILVPVSVFYQYWKTSLADFTASQIAFWVTLFLSAETGIELAALFMIAYVLLRSAFMHVKTITPFDYTLALQKGDEPEPTELPQGIQLMRLSQSITFVNAYSSKNDILESVQTYNLGVPPRQVPDAERSWSDVGAQNIATLRARAQVSSSTLPQFRFLILDLAACPYIDTTGIQALKDLKAELLSYGGESIELRFTGVGDSVRTSFERAGWILGEDGRDGAFDTVADAILAPVNPVKTSTSTEGTFDEEQGYDDDVKLVGSRSASAAYKSRSAMF